LPLLLPVRCYQTVVDAHQAPSLLDHKDSLIRSFEEECQTAREMMSRYVSLCAGNRPEDRLDCYNQFEASLKELGEVFRWALSEVGQLSEAFYLSDFQQDLFHKCMDLMYRQVAALTRLLTMLRITGEKTELKARGLENIGLLPQGATDAIIDWQEESAALEKFEEDTRLLVKTIQANIERYTEREAEKEEANLAKKPAKIEPGTTTAKEHKDEPTTISNVTIQNFQGILGNVHGADNVHIGNSARIHKNSKKPAETEQTTGIRKLGWRGWLLKLYEKTLKVVVDAFLERVWPK